MGMTSMCMSNSISDAVQHSSTFRAQRNMQPWASPSSTAQSGTAACPLLFSTTLGLQLSKVSERQQRLSAWPATSHHCLQQFGTACSCPVLKRSSRCRCDHLLCIVVPAAFGSVAENKVQHKGCIKNVKLAAVPVAVVCKIVLRHLRPQVATLAE